MYTEKQHSALLGGICWLIYEIGLHLHFSSEVERKGNKPVICKYATCIKTLIVTVLIFLRYVSNHFFPKGKQKEQRKRT